MHQACGTLIRCIECLRWDQRIVEMFYYYMCFLLNIFQHELQSSNTSMKGTSILLLPYIHLIDSELPNAFINVSGYHIWKPEMRVVLRFFSLFTLYVNDNLIWILLILIPIGSTPDICSLRLMSSLTSLVVLTWMLKLGQPRMHCLSTY